MRRRIIPMLITAMIVTLFSGISPVTVAFASPSNLVSNPSFESDLAGWTWMLNGGAQATCTMRTDGPYDGGKYVRITNNSSYASEKYGILYQYISVQPNTKYIISVKARSSGLAMCWYGGNPAWSSRFYFSKDSLGKWLTYEATITTGSETSWPLMFLTEDITAQLDIDSVCMKAANQAENSGFESDFTSWDHYTAGGADATIAIRTDSPYNGSKYARIANNSSYTPDIYACITQTITDVQPYSSYVITIRARTSDANNCWFGGGPGWNTRFPVSVSSGGSWTEYKKTIITGNETSWELVFLSEGPTAYFDIDTVRIEKVAATAPGWHGDSIWYPEPINYPIQPVPERAERYFRKTFTLTTIPERAVLTITASYMSKVCVNGSTVNSTMHGLIPKTYAITRYLATGTNVIAIQARSAGAGDYATDPSYWSRALDASFGYQCCNVTADVDIENSNGSKTDLIHTNTSWKAYNTLVSGWTTAGFNDGSWPNAVLTGTFPSAPFNNSLIWPSDEEMQFSGLEFTTPPAGLYFTTGSAKTIKLRLSALKFRDTVTSAQIDYVVTNYAGTAVQTGSLTGVTFTNGIADVTLSIASNSVEWYTVTFSGTVWSGSDRRNVYVRNMVTGGNSLNFAINDPSVDVASSSFGINSGDVLSNAALYNKLGFGWDRIGTYWEDMQITGGGPIKWGNLDYAVNNAVANDIKPVIILSYCARWASTAPPGTSEWAKTVYAPDMAKWQAYVNAVVSRYKDRVKYWEIWNEPDCGNWQSSQSSFVTLVQTAYSAIKAQDATATVLLAGLGNGGTSWLDYIYKNGGKGYFDVISIHPYSQPNPPEGNIPASIGRFAAVASDNGDAGRAIWITEIGQQDAGDNLPNNNRTPDEVSRYLVRTNVLGIAYGAQKVIWYTDTMGFYGSRYFSEYNFGISHFPDFSPKQSAQTAAIMTKYLNGAAYSSKLDLGSSTLWGFKFVKGSSERYVLWSSGSNTDVTLNLGVTSVLYSDMIGRTQALTSGNGQYTINLSQAPCYIIK